MRRGSLFEATVLARSGDLRQAILLERLQLHFFNALGPVRLDSATRVVGTVVGEIVHRVVSLDTPGDLPPPIGAVSPSVAAQYTPAWADGAIRASPRGAG
jgi:hypothetical protein